MAFQVWSRKNTSANETLRPVLDVTWDQLTHEDKYKMWQHLTNKEWFKGNAVTLEAVHYLNETARKNSYGESLLNHGGPHTYKKEYDNNVYYKDCCFVVAVSDFERIFRHQPVDVVLELLSFYAMGLESRKLGEDKDFASFLRDLNDVIRQFGLNYQATEIGFIPKQDEKISKEIWRPVIQSLSDNRWQSVNHELSTAFNEYRKGTHSGYSAVVTHAVNALQAYLQILVHEKTGKGDILDLLNEARKKGLINDQELTHKLLKEIESVLARVRMQTGNAHPKQEYANDVTALFVLNTTIVALQYLISSQGK